MLTVDCKLGPVLERLGNERQFVFFRENLEANSTLKIRVGKPVFRRSRALW